MVRPTRAASKLIPIATAALVTVLLAAGGCASDDDAVSTGPSIDPHATTSTTSTPTEAPTTPTTAPSDECHPEPVLARANEMLALARLAPTDTWDLIPDITPFAERTVDAEEFAQRQGLDCGLQSTALTDDNHQVLLLAAWTGDRLTLVIQATGAPSEPFAPDAQWDLLIEWARGEILEGPFRVGRADRTTWAATLEAGETVLISAHDYSAGATAKHWQAGIETSPPEEYVSLDAERYGIEQLRAAGGRNVDVAELPELDSEIGTLQLVSPTGQTLEVRVAPLGWFDPATEWHQRPITSETIGDTEVFVSESGPPDDADILTYDLAHMSFECDRWVWQVITSYGTVDELRGFVGSLLEVSGC